MALIKVIFFFGALAVVFTENNGLKLHRYKKDANEVNETNETARYDSGMVSNMNQYTCKGYYECMAQLQHKEIALSSLKSEQGVLLSTMTSVNKKALEQERLLNKLMPQHKHMKKEMEQLNQDLTDCQEEYINYVNLIAELESELHKYKRIIEETIHMCTRQVGSYDLDRTDTGVYYFSAGAANTWWEAQNECRRHGMNLVSIDSEEESIYISNKLIDDAILSNNGDWVWIGLNNFETGDAEYMWVGTGEGTDQSTSDGTNEVDDWDTDNGEPANIATNNCVAIGFYDATQTSNAWYTKLCGDPAGYVCELPPICYHLFEIEFSMK